MSNYPATAITRAEKNPLATFLKNLFGPLGSFLGAFFLISDPLLSIGTLFGGIILWRALDYMFNKNSKSSKTTGIVLAILGGLFGLLTY